MPSSPLTLYLLRRGLRPEKARLRRPADYEEIALVDPPMPDMSWRLFVKQNPSTGVAWLGRLRSIMQSPDALRLFTQSAGAVLLMTVSGRLWATTFGTGFHAIDQGDVEPGFGLRVAANTIDPRRVTMAETMGLERGARNAISVLPSPSEMFALRVATNEEWVKRFGGKIFDHDFGVTISGADSLRMNLEDFRLMDLPAKVVQILGHFESEAYKRQFPFLDYFRQIPNTAPIVPTLNAALDQLLASRDLGIGFASPEGVNPHHPDEYVLKHGRRGVVVGELSADLVYPALDELGAWENPRTNVVVVPQGGDVDGDDRQPLARYLVASVRVEDEGSRPSTP